MTASRLGSWVVGTFAIFILVNVASYFFRSDFYGMPGANDAIIRIGFPYTMFVRGGFAYREYLSVRAALGNMLVAGATVVAFMMFRTFNAKGG